MHLVATLQSSSLSLRAKVKHLLAVMPPRHRKLAAIAAGLAVAGVVALVTPDPALAQSANLEGFANNVLGLLSSGLLRALAIIAVIIAGAGWLMGRVNTGGLVTVIIGIAIIFSAPWIVDQIAGSA
jgi:type IV secretion system protein VirB2